MSKQVTCLFVIALCAVCSGSAKAADTLWSVDIQGVGGPLYNQLDPPVLMEGVEPIYGAGNVWNAFNVPGHDLPALVDPSIQLVDSKGKETLVTFGITGNICGFSYNNVLPLLQDYLFVNAGNSDVSVGWYITGLKAGSSYELYTYGGGVVGRDVGLTVDEDGDGDLGNNQVVNVPTDGYLFTVKASAEGSIIGQAGPGTAGEGNWSGFQLRGAYQVEASSGPRPETDGTDVLRDAILSWIPGQFAQTHNVYFGTSLDSVQAADLDSPLDVLVGQGLDVNSFDPGRLAFNQTYYWRVDEVNGAPDRTVFKGDVWRFTVEPYSLPIETITATASSANAANMGPEKTIDGSGLNALDQHSTEGTDMWLSATGDPDIWIQYAFDRVYKLDGMDWTAGGIKSLSLYFQGSADNTGQLYIKINGTKLSYNGDAADITASIWQPWIIDLATTGANLGNVTTLTLGVEGAGAAGQLTIDDIRLYPQVPEYLTPVAPDNTNLIAHYALDGDGLDSSGNGFDGLIEGDVTFVDGVVGLGSDHNGSNALINCGDVPLGDSGALSVAFWVKPRNISQDWAGYVSKWTLDNSQRTFWLGQHSTDGWLRFGIYPTGPAAETSVDSGQVILVNEEWTHIGCTHDGNIQRIYAQGVEIVASPPRNAGIIDRGGNLRLGIVATSNWFDGTLDDVHIYDRALSPEELAWLAGKRAPVVKPF